MSILKIIEDYDRQREAKITHLEGRVKELTSALDKLERTQAIKNQGLVDLLLDKITCPDGLEFDGRDFVTDLKSLITLTAAKRFEGHKCHDEQWRRIPWFPYPGFCHRWLDAATGFINCASSVRKMSQEELHSHIEQRSKWIDALLIEVNKIM